MTVFSNELTPMQILYISLMSLGSIGFVINEKPMLSSTLNKVEICNDLFVLVTTYFMLIFTDWQS